MVVIRLKWKKWDNSKEMANCWYCGSPTNYVLYGTNEKYFELFSCKKCKGRHGRIIKRKVVGHKNTQSLKISDITKGKEREKQHRRGC